MTVSVALFRCERAIARIVPLPISRRNSEWPRVGVFVIFAATRIRSRLPSRRHQERRPQLDQQQRKE